MASASATTVLSTKGRVPWPRRLPQGFLFCLACGSQDVCARGLCRSCYDAAYHDDSYFAGAKAHVLARDGQGCRVCGEATNVVHHRRPGCDPEQWLITLCPACHATVERLQRLDRYLPPLLLALWREQHPDAGEQLAFALDASWEVTPGEPPSTWTGRSMVMSEETLPVLASSAPEQSSLPPEEKRRRLVELVVNSVPSQTSQRVYRMGVEQFFDWWGASAAGEARFRAA
jgi:hypothetical protein